MWQHLFWFFGHPEVYIAILPGMGLTSHLLATFARKPIFGYRAMVYAIFAIGFLGFFVWGHHMFMSGMSPYTAIAFSLMTLTIGVPSAIKTFNWLGTVWDGQIRFTSPMLFALGFVSLFVSGGITGLFLGQTSIDIQLHDTYFVVGHFHLIMGVAAIFGMFAGTYFWFPKMFGKMMHEGMGKIHFFLTFIGVYAIFIPMHIMGVAGATRRYAFHYNPVTGEGLQYLAPMTTLTGLVSYAAIITMAAQLIFLAIWFIAGGKGRKRLTIPGKRLRSNGLFLRRRRMIISRALSLWFIMGLMNSACRAQRKIIRCKPTLRWSRRTETDSILDFWIRRS